MPIFSSSDPYQMIHFHGERCKVQNGSIFSMNNHLLYPAFSESQEPPKSSILSKPNKPNKPIKPIRPSMSTNKASTVSIALKVIEEEQNNRIRLGKPVKPKRRKIRLTIKH